MAACGGGDEKTIDAAVHPDGAVADAGVDAGAPDADDRILLSQQGLYTDIATQTVVPEAIEYTPSFGLWADGAAKRRWIVLPPGGVIDTSDMNHWVFPVGTKFFKEFSLGGQRLETRMIFHKQAGDTPTAYTVGSFIWYADGSDAEFQSAGANDVLGTDHDVPNATKCWTCHNGEKPGHIIGFSAVQLSRVGTGATDVTLDYLIMHSLLSAPPALGADFGPPGDSLVTRPALGYLHANCGHCHNPEGTAFNDTDQVMRLSVEERDPLLTATYTTMVGQDRQYWNLLPVLPPGITKRIVAGDSAHSAAWFRMMTRDGTLDQMPPIFTKHVDDTGLAAVTTWIDSL